MRRDIELYDLSLRDVVESLKLPDVPALSPQIRQLVLFNKIATAEGSGRIVATDNDERVLASARDPLPTVSALIGSKRI